MSAAVQDREAGPLPVGRGIVGRQGLGRRNTASGIDMDGQRYRARRAAQPSMRAGANATANPKLSKDHRTLRPRAHSGDQILSSILPILRMDRGPDVNAYYSRWNMPHWRAPERDKRLAPRDAASWQNPPSLSRFRSTLLERITYFLNASCRGQPVTRSGLQHPH